MNSNHDDDAGLLRAKYAELTRKYTKLVERLDRRNTRHSAVFELGSWGLQMRGAALVMVRDGRIVLANSRLGQLAGRGKGPWVREDDGQSYSDLRAVVLREARRLDAAQSRYHEAVFRHGDDDFYLSVRTQAGGAGKQAFVAVLLEDVTEDARRDHELVHTRDALVHRERLRVLGELAAAVAHDLGNTLRGASFEIAALGQVGNGALAGVARRVEVASQIVGQLHDFARSGAVSAGMVNLGEIIEQAVTLAEIELRERAPPIRVIRTLPDLPLVRASAAELSLLFVNLLRNARDAMPDGGTVTISGRVTARQVVIRIADTGAGISPDLLPRVFQPFFTTKGAAGAGLGLWLAKGTMERLGGDIAVANDRAGGAVFSLKFRTDGEVSPPRTVERRDRGSGARPSPALPRRGRARRGAQRT